MILLALWSCAAGQGVVGVGLILSRDQSGPALDDAVAAIGSVSLHTADTDWSEGWVDLTPSPELVFGEGRMSLAWEEVPAGRYDHVSISIEKVVVPWVCGDEPTVALALEPIAAPFRLGSYDVRTLDLTLLALADLDDVSSLRLFAIDTLVE